jgi:enterochelin esterase-like enzyme
MKKPFLSTAQLYPALLMSFLLCLGQGESSGEHFMPNKNQPTGKGQWIDTIKLAGSVKINDSQIIKDTGRMLVYLPAGYNGKDSLPLAIALHGWGQKPDDWRKNTKIELLADHYQVILAVPAMGKTVYEYQYYPESKSKWSQIPGARWIGEVVLPYMVKNYAVSHQQSHTTLIGVSTGGRGAVVVGERYPAFGFVASVSGTYDLNILGKSEGEYKIHKVIFGDRDSFPDRWKEENCINAKWIDALKKVTLYIAHGENDPVVQPSQLESMRGFLKSLHHNYQIVLVKKAKHDWVFWDSQLPAIFDLMVKSFSADSSKDQ